MAEPMSAPLDGDEHDRAADERAAAIQAHADDAVRRATAELREQLAAANGRAEHLRAHNAVLAQDKADWISSGVHTVERIAAERDELCARLDGLGEVEYQHRAVGWNGETYAMPTTNAEDSAQVRSVIRGWHIERRPAYYGNWEPRRPAADATGDGSIGPVSNSSATGGAIPAEGATGPARGLSEPEPCPHCGGPRTIIRTEYVATPEAHGMMRRALMTHYTRRPQGAGQDTAKETEA